MTEEFSWSPEDNRCFGCGDNPWGLKLRFERRDGWVVAHTVLDENYQGFEEITHGGIVSTLLDEAASWAIILQHSVYGPSYHLECEFQQPVPVDEALIIRGRSQSPRHGVSVAQAEVLNEESTCLASGEIKCKIRQSIDLDSFLDERE